MKVIHILSQMQKIALSCKNKKTIAVVPTMGFLHEGHLSLVKTAQKKAKVVIVTLFVNPTQFGPKEDFGAYPRDTKGDLAKLKKLNVDYVFIPPIKDMYPDGFQTSVSVLQTTKPLCGNRRPGHFDGVTLVVTKLFLLTQPDFAVFGMKDFQQLVTIECLVKDLNMPVKIVRGKTVREKDGLAMSSRNSYLTSEERALARSLYQGLSKIRKTCAKTSCLSTTMQTVFLSEIPHDSRIRVDYCEILDAKHLTPIKKYQKNKTLVAVAVFVGKTRLIDNMIF